MRLNCSTKSCPKFFDETGPRNYVSNSLYLCLFSIVFHHNVVASLFQIDIAKQDNYCACNCLRVMSHNYHNETRRMSLY